MSTFGGVHGPGAAHGYMLNKYLERAHREGKSIDEMAAKMAQDIATLNKKAAEMKLPDDLREINLAPLVTSSNKASRGALLAARFEAGHVHFVRGAHYRLIDHLVQFDATEGGADDLFDALDHAVQASEKKAKSQRRVREEEPDLI